jgi:hypothetical protein
LLRPLKGLDLETSGQEAEEVDAEDVPSLPARPEEDMLMRDVALQAVSTEGCAVPPVTLLDCNLAAPGAVQT